MFDALIFAVTDLGFVARSAREEEDDGEFRLAKIQRIIAECNYGVHDISAVKLDNRHGLPRFNIPLGLGLFLGCKLQPSLSHKRGSSCMANSSRAGGVWV